MQREDNMLFDSCWHYPLSILGKTVFLHLIRVFKFNVLTLKPSTYINADCDSIRKDVIFWWGLWVMVFNATFNNISVISWLSVLLVEETRIPEENHRPAACHWQTLSHKVARVHLAWVGFELTTLVVIGTDFTSSSNSNYYKITTTEFLVSFVECQSCSTSLYMFMFLSYLFSTYRQVMTTIKI
jgi:hypothetical protein